MPTSPMYSNHTVTAALFRTPNSPARLARGWHGQALDCRFIQTRTSVQEPPLRLLSLNPCGADNLGQQLSGCYLVSTLGPSFCAVM